MAEYAAIIGVAIAAIGAATTVAASVSQAKAQERQGKTQQSIAEFNAKVAENEALAKRQQGEALAEERRERGRRVLAAQRAGFGAAGVTQEGSPLLVMLDTAAQSELDAMRAVHGGELIGAGFESRATLERFQGRAQRQAANIGAGTTLLTGFSTAAGQAGRAFGP